MGTNKKRSVKPQPQLRSRTTRSRGKALENPADNTQQLTEQLRALGLYAAPTLGDGNCLFRALSDQLYGTPSYHLKLRKDICDWIEAHKERYEPFAEDERGLSVHLQCMRQQATYGGHMELSAFAHMTKRNVKIIQPGLVYVIEWDAGGEGDTGTADDAKIQHVASESTEDLPNSTSMQDATADQGQKKMTRRERKRAEKENSVQPETAAEDDEKGSLGPIYVAYHDWEHFSSIRNLRGPHSGLPYVQETPAPEDEQPDTPVFSKKRPPSKSFTKPPAKTRTKAERRRDSVAPNPPVTAVESPPMALTPSQVPLPESRSPSPISESRASLTPPTYPLPPASSLPPRMYRSPKRTFDESSASSESSQSLAKRARGTSVAPPDSRDSMLSAHRSSCDDEGGIDTPELMFSAPGSPVSSMSSLSELSSRAPTPPSQTLQARPLTRRERKKLGLPKPRAVGGARPSAGTIIIPGGRYKRRSTPTVHTGKEKDIDSEEWIKNGTGREDVRGFRELRI